MSPKKKMNDLSKEEAPKEDAVVKEMNSVKVLALWKGFSPDARPYKPSTPIIEFPEPLTIITSVPLDPELIKNASVISIAQMTNQTEPKAQFTPMGMRYIIDQFESAMSNGKSEQEEPAKAEGEDWGDDENDEEFKVDKKVNKSAPADDDDEEDWGEEEKSESKSDDAPWDEEW